MFNGGLPWSRYDIVTLDVVLWPSRLHKGGSSIISVNFTAYTAGGFVEPIHSQMGELGNLIERYVKRLGVSRKFVCTPLSSDQVITSPLLFSQTNERPCPYTVEKHELGIAADTVLSRILPLSMFLSICSRQSRLLLGAQMLWMFPSSLSQAVNHCRVLTFTLCVCMSHPNTARRSFIFHKPTAYKSLQSRHTNYRNNNICRVSQPLRLYKGNNETQITTKLTRRNLKRGQTNTVILLQLAGCRGGGWVGKVGIVCTLI